MNRLSQLLTTGWRFASTQTLGDWGSWASLVSLAMTAWIAWRLRAIQRRHVSRVRLPQLVAHVREKLGNLNALIVDPNRRERDVLDVLNALAVDLKYITGKTTRENGRRAKTLNQKISRRNGPLSEAWLTEVFDDGVSLMRHIREATRDANVEVIA